MSMPGLKMPAFVYGTAWKKDRTQSLVMQAFGSGFVAVDTAAQPRHYREEGVGSALRQGLAEGAFVREDVFIQTKYTPLDGQDRDTAPYKPTDSVADQVRASVTSSLHNLRTDDDEHNTYIDCVLLHSPLDTVADTLAAWNALEEYVPHKIRHLGISNINLNNLEIFYDLVQIKPHVIQNRFFSKTQYDSDVRRFCVQKGMVYQAYWTLTANPALLGSEPVLKISEVLGVEKEAAMYCLVLSLKNVVALNGTTNLERMRADVDAIKNWQAWSAESDNRRMWEKVLADFMILVGDDVS